MARMIPPQPRADTASAAEEMLFAQLKHDLPADYTVFHGVEWALGPQDYEADFVIAHPEHGVLIVEVKGGVIAVDGAEDQWYSEDISGLRRRIKDPVRQARRTMYALRSLLEESPATGPYRYGVVRAVAFPDTVVHANDFPGVPREQIIDCRDLSHLRKAIERAWTASMPAGPGSAGVESLARTLSPTVGVTVQDRIERERKELQRLTAEQLQVKDEAPYWAGSAHPIYNGSIMPSASAAITARRIRDRYTRHSTSPAYGSPPTFTLLGRPG